MDNATDRFQRSIEACLDHGKNLLEQGQWTLKESTGLALLLLAQEEFAKAFALTQVRDGTLPWTPEVRRSLYIHECKNLMAIIMEWLHAANEVCRNEPLTTRIERREDAHLPPDVATAMNIYRHEMIDRIRKQSPERWPEWRGRARKVAHGLRDREKQAALYVGIGEDGDVTSVPSASTEILKAEQARAQALREIADDVQRKCIFAFREYEQFTRILKKMFADLERGVEGEMQDNETRVPSGIPGVVFVERTIFVADVVRPDDNGEPVAG